MLWLQAGMAWSTPPQPKPEDLDWLVGLWASTSPVQFTIEEGRGGVAVVKQDTRGPRGRQVEVISVSQTLLGKPPPAEPWWLLEEIWFEPDGVFLQVWLGQDKGESVRLLPHEVSPGKVVFQGASDRFPARIELIRNGTGIIVAHQGPYQGVPKRLEWHYQPTEPLLELHRKARETKAR